MQRTYFEDVVLGEPVRFGRYEVERDEIIEFASRWDPQPFHLNEEAGKQSVFGGLTACFAHAFSIQCQIVMGREDRLAVVAGLGFENAVMKQPVRPGDVLYVENENVAKRLSESKPDRGIVTTQARLKNQSHETTLEVRGLVLVQVRNP